jgi:hypothetical protein
MARNEREAPHQGLAQASSGQADASIIPDRPVRNGLPTSLARLAAWRRLRGAPAGGDWWGGCQMWSWETAERSRRAWPA